MYIWPHSLHSSDLHRTLWHSTCLWGFLRTSAHISSLPSSSQEKEIAASSTRCRTNLLLGMAPSSQARFILSKLYASSLYSKPGDSVSLETAPFAHYLSLIGRNFMHDNAHIKKYLRMAPKVCPFTPCQEIPDLIPNRNHK